MNPTTPQRGLLVLGRSAAMQNVQREIEQVASTKQPVLILGETGTGKDVVARELHARSRRAERTWQTVNCGTLSLDTAANSELFGHAKGAFTGAERARVGLIRSANGGTLFLDEVGALPLSVQAKLLRVFEDPQVRALGDDATHSIDVRFIAATSADVESEIARGVWKRDFFARFTRTIEVPPLRERLDDLEALALHFIQTHRCDEGHNSRASRISARGLEHLCSYRWPGNARELRQVIERALAATASAGIEELDVPHLELPSPRSPTATTRAGFASDALGVLAASIIDELESGERPPESIDKIVRRFPDLDLGKRLAQAFFARFTPADRETKSRALFGYSSGNANGRGVESVRRFLPSRPPPSVPEK